MNDVIIGVKRISKETRSSTAEPDEEAIGAVQVHWMTIDGIVVPGNVVSVETHHDDGPMLVTVKFLASGFRTVDFNDPEHRPDPGVLVFDAVVHFDEGVEADAS